MQSSGLNNVGNLGGSTAFQAKLGVSGRETFFFCWLEAESLQFHSMYYMVPCTPFADNNVWFIVSSVSHFKGSYHTFCHELPEIAREPHRKGTEPSHKIVDGLLAPL